MSWTKIILMGMISSSLSSIAAILYAKLYAEAFMIDFSMVMPVSSIITACLIGCLLMVIGYKLAHLWKGELLIGWLNIFYSMLSFASIAGVLGFELPLEVEFPEMFPGFAIPMHFFPALALFTIYPLFMKSKSQLK